MAKKKKLEPSVPSKAYLVSFGDTMTALLAFFIVLNSLAKEQTGANMYSGTGSFANAFTNSGLPGGLPGNRSREMIQQEAQKPVYALADNLAKNDQTIGPDDSDENERVIDRDQEQFQKFLSEIEKTFGLEQHPALKNQTVFDSFEKSDLANGVISDHLVELLSQAIAKLRQSDVKVELIIWATMPSQRNLDIQLEKSTQLRSQVERMFWLKPAEKQRLTYRVKPWLFADARRPFVSLVISRTGEKSP